MALDVYARRLAISLLTLAGVFTLGVSMASAQSMEQRTVGGPISGIPGPKPRQATPAPATALPGESAGSDRVIPADHSAADMSPTDSLFDAVIRGDLPAARDAIARGADFNAHNELGQTPLDESIDLGRNNITFMLLSLRGGPNDTGPATTTVAAPSKPAKPVTAVSARPAATLATQAPAPKPSPTQASASPVAPISGDPGTPNPQRGFLGFGG